MIENRGRNDGRCLTEDDALLILPVRVLDQAAALPITTPSVASMVDHGGSLRALAEMVLPRLVAAMALPVITFVDDGASEKRAVPM